MGWLPYYSPKFYDNVFLFVGFTNLGTFIEFLMVGFLSQVSKRFNHEYYATEGANLFSHYWDLHQFIGHCPIHLDPCPDSSG